MTVLLSVICSSIGAQYAHFDPNYGPGGIVFSATSPSESDGRYGGCLDAQGRILQFGSSLIPTSGTQQISSIIRFLPEGQPDHSYGTNGRLIIPGVLMHTGALLPSGKIMTHHLAGSQYQLLRLTPDGIPDTTFGTGGFMPVPFPNLEHWAPMVTTSDGRIIFGYDPSSAYHTFYVTMIREDGTLDTAFAEQGLFTAPAGIRGWVHRVVEDAHGNFLVGGAFGPVDGSLAAGLFRLTPSGVLDTTFGENGFTRYGDLGVNSSGVVSAILLEPDGSFIVGGSRRIGNAGVVVTMAKFLANGALDPSIPNNGSPLPPFANEPRRLHVYDLARDRDGRIMAFGQLRSESGMPSKQPAWACFDPTFMLDTAFGDQGLLRVEGTSFMNFEGWILTMANGDLVANSYFARPGSNQGLGGITRLSHDLSTASEEKVPIDRTGAYPNPAIDHIIIPADGAERPASFTIHDLTGRSVLSHQLGSKVVGPNGFRVDLPDLMPNGVYLLTCRSGADRERTIRFVVHR